MPQQKFCTNANSLLEEIKTLKLAFESAYHTANSSGDEEDIKVARDLRDSLKNKMDELQEEMNQIFLFDEEYSVFVKRKENYSFWKEFEYSANTISMLFDGTIVAGGTMDYMRIWSTDKNDSSSASWERDAIEGNESAYCNLLAVCPNGRIVCGDYQNKDISILSRMANGEWKPEIKKEHFLFVKIVKTLPDGRMISINNKGEMNLLFKNAEGEWVSKVFEQQKGDVIYVKIIPDGRIVTIDRTGTACFWSEEKNGEWSTECVVCRGNPETLKALPDGRFVFVGAGGEICILYKNTQGDWDTKQLKVVENISGVLHAFTDGRIVYADYDGLIHVHSENKDGTWKQEILKSNGGEFGQVVGIKYIEPLPDGRVVSLDKRSRMKIWSRSNDGTWDYKEILGIRSNIGVFKVLPNGLIITGGSQKIQIFDGHEV